MAIVSSSSKTYETLSGFKKNPLTKDLKVQQIPAQPNKPSDQLEPFI